MNLEECYNELQGNYNDAKQRLMNDSIIEKFALKFLSDSTMNELRKAVNNKNQKESFRSVHTLKGVAANLGFTKLYNAASNLTEQLRDGTKLADEDLFERVEESYDLVIKTLNKYK